MHRQTQIQPSQMELLPQRLLPPVVLLLATPLFVGAPSLADDATSSVHPVVLVPGNTCGQLDARLTDRYEPPTPGCGIPKQGRGWFRLWDREPHRAAAVLCRLAAAGVRPRRRRLPQHAGRQDSGRVLRLHPQLPLRRSCTEVSYAISCRIFRGMR